MEEEDGLCDNDELRRLLICAIHSGDGTNCTGSYRGRENSNSITRQYIWII